MYSKLLNKGPSSALFKHPWATSIHEAFMKWVARGDNLGHAERCSVGWPAGCWQSLAPLSRYFSFSLPEFLLTVSCLFLSDIMTFCCDIHEHFFAYFPVKCKECPLFTCIAGLVCVLGVSHMSMSVCQASSLLCDSRRAFLYSQCQLRSIKKPPSCSEGPPSALLSPAGPAWCGWVKDWNWTRQHIGAGGRALIWDSIPTGSS